MKYEKKTEKYKVENKIIQYINNKNILKSKEKIKLKLTINENNKTQ